MENLPIVEPFRAAKFIKEIGRGKKGSRDMSRDDAFQLYAAMLEGRVSDLEMGGIMLAMRIKGESVDEIAGFLDAAETSFVKLSVPAVKYAPVIIPSYNGSRNMPNLTPLLALLLARCGVPVLIHGVTVDPGRVTTAEILQYLSVPFAYNAAEAASQLGDGHPVFMPIESLAPRMAHLLAMRRILGVRNSTHTLVKIIQPFTGPALRLTSYTHPEYFQMLSDYFMIAMLQARGGAFLMRGTEGETVANAKRAQQIEWFYNGERALLVPKQAPVDITPPLPTESDAKTTAEWIQSALNGEIAVPPSIAEQVEHCVRAAELISNKRNVLSLE